MKLTMKTLVPNQDFITNNAFPRRKRLYIFSSSSSFIILSLFVLLSLLPPASILNKLVLAHQDDSLQSTTPIGTDDQPTPSSSTTTDVSPQETLRLGREWATSFGRDVHYGTQEVTCVRSIRERFDPANYKSSIVSIDWTKEHSEIVKTISNTMSWHKTAVEAIASASEQLAGAHVFNDKRDFHFDYVDVHCLHDIDEEDTIDQDDSGSCGSINSTATFVNTASNSDLTDSTLGNKEMGQLDDNGLDSSDSDGGQDTEQPPEPLPTPAKLQQQRQNQQEPSRLVQDQQQQETLSKIGDSSLAPVDLSSNNSDSAWKTPMRFLKLEKHKNFGDVPVSTEDSAVHVPVHIYPGDPQVMNAIAWSDGLTNVFRNNFVRNPKLTNQYFASQHGFMRLYPAQKWQIDQKDPDLYDARMRPWYVAGASSRKDVIILVDSSGSMTGSRRDIAKGVVFELLDTLTDNDHFLILKFSDTIQQVGLPSCPQMRMKRRGSSIPEKNTITLLPDSSATTSEYSKTFNSDQSTLNGTDIDSFFLSPASGRNVRHVKANFTIPTSGIANFSHALITAFEVLHNYQTSDQLGSQCNQAIMLITDGSPSDFEDIFNRYNYPNAPVRVFTYLIGREGGDGTHTKMMACHNRGYYTHVINLAGVRETVQQYIPVMARPLVLNGTHPITWTPAYGELTYQILTDWIWESRRRDKSRAILAAHGRGSPSNTDHAVPEIKVTNDDGPAYSPEDENYEETLEEELETIDLFGYNSNPDCFWQTRQNDLLTTVVQPVYDPRNTSIVTERFLVKNVWTEKKTLMRTAQILGVAAADMKINDIISLAPSHKLGTNGYAIMLTNNGYAMHHPDLRSILEPFTSDPSDKNMRILKPFFSSLDFTQVEHILNPQSSLTNNYVEIRNEAVTGKTGWGELLTKRTLDCQKRVQSRLQSFYYKPIQQFPFSFLIAIPQPYGSYRIEAQIEIKNSSLPEKLTTYFTTSDYDIWTVHPDYQYCDGPSNNSITTLLDMFLRIEDGKLGDIIWRPAESSKPPVFLPGKIVCDKDLVQSLVFDANATFSFSEKCGPPSPIGESSLLSMLGVRFSFLATRSGLTRVRHYADDLQIKKEALAFARKHARAVDETYYSRTVDYNMLVNESATLIQVPFNAFETIREQFKTYEMNQLKNLDSSSFDAPLDGDSTSNGIDSNNNPDIVPAPRLSAMNLFERLGILTNTSLNLVATQSIIVNEGSQRAVVGVTGIFYDYATFVMRFFNSTNNRVYDGKPNAISCGSSSDTIDCLLIDNNGYIVVSEDLDYIGRHLKAYDPHIMTRLVSAGVFHEVNVTDYQAVCMREEEKQTASSASFSTSPLGLGRVSGFPRAIGTIVSNFVATMAYTWTIMVTTTGVLLNTNQQRAYAQYMPSSTSKQSNQQQPMQTPMSQLMPNKTYLRPCEKTLTLYETRPRRSSGSLSSESLETYTTRCGCKGWFVYEQVPKTNLFLLIVDSELSCRQGCDPGSQLIDPTDPVDAKYPDSTSHVCSMLERESKLNRTKLDSCFYHHPDEQHIKLCGAAGKSASISLGLLAIVTIFSLILSSKIHEDIRP